MLMSPTLNPADLLTPVEAAAVLRITPDAVRSLIRRGKIPAFHRGERCLLISREALLALLRERAVR